MMKKTILFTLSVLFLVQISSAQLRYIQNKNGTLTALEQQSNNLDSLLNNWYIKRSINNKETKGSAVPDFLVGEVSDSVYISRLQKIPSIFNLTYNGEVKKWINLYVKRNRRTPYLIGMSDYYFPIFEEILDSYGLPIELKYLPIIESALNPRAKSRAGAVGLWQFLYSTGKMYGLEVNSYVDERSDPLKSTHAAASFLKDMYDVYGDWTLVLAAYNCGPGNVNKAIRRSGGLTNYWEIYPYLPRETRGYVPAFIGALYAMNYYDKHNIRPAKIDMNIFTDTVMVNRKLHLMQVAEVLNIPFEELVEINPQYRKNIIPGNYKPYPLRLPVKETSNFVALAETIYNYKDTVFFSGKSVIVQAPQFSRSKYSSYSYASSSSFTPPSTKGKKKIIYTVKSGDTYGFIASWYNVRTSDLKYWNNSYSNRLDIGQKLDVWVPEKRYNYYKNLNTKTFKQKQNTKGKTVKHYSKKASKAYSNKFVWYKIKSGDNLGVIAKKYPGVSESDIKKINDFSSRDLRRLQIGQIIKIKRK